MANRYVIIDGQLQRSSPEASRWIQRASKGIPKGGPEEPDAVALPTEDKRSLAEVIESLDETPEL